MTDEKSATPTLDALIAGEPAPPVLTGDAVSAALRRKRARTLTITLGVPVEGEDHPVRCEFTFRALGSWQADALVREHPPQDEDTAAGFHYHLDTYAPALVAATLVSPDLSERRIGELWESAEWSGGELGLLFAAAIRVNSQAT